MSQVVERRVLAAKLAARIEDECFDGSFLNTSKLYDILLEQELSLRDTLAGHAIGGIMASLTGSADVGQVAASAYLVADAMLFARGTVAELVMVVGDDTDTPKPGDQ